MTKNSITRTLTLEQIDRCHNMMDYNKPHTQEDYELLYAIFSDYVYAAATGTFIIVEQTDNVIEVDIESAGCQVTVFNHFVEGTTETVEYYTDNNVIDIFTKKARW